MKRFNIDDEYLRQKQLTICKQKADVAVTFMVLRGMEEPNGLIGREEILEQCKERSEIGTARSGTPKVGSTRSRVSKVRLRGDLSRT
jgi:hypothetical protein